MESVKWVRVAVERLFKGTQKRLFGEKATGPPFPRQVKD